MNGKFICLCLLSLIAGILAGESPFVHEWDALFPLSLALGAFAINWILSHKNPFHNFNWINDIIACSLFLGIGVFSSSLRRPAEYDFKKGDYYFTGIVKDYTPTVYGDKLLVRLNELDFISGKNKQHALYPRNVDALITLQDASNISYGDQISGRASLQPVECPSNFRNDDYISYLKQKGILLTGFTDGEKCNIVYSAGSFSSFFLSLRDNLESKIESTYLAQDTKSFLISILLGDKAYINKDDRLTFSDAGVSHIFAVSGLHVSLVSLGVLGLLSFIFWGRARIWKFIICIPLIWFYVLLVGCTPSTCRAGLMISVALLALVLQRKYNPLKTLGWTVILILSFMPRALFDIGFQLSVVCVGSLILLVKPLNFVDHRAHPWLFKTVSLILVSLVATFSSWLLCAFYFHRFSLMFLPMNLIAVPLLPPFLIISVLYLVLFFIGVRLSFLAHALNYIYNLFLKGSELVTSFSTPIQNLHPHILSVCCWIAGVILLAFLLNRHRLKLQKLWLPFSFFSLAIITIFIIPAKLPDGFIIQKNSSSQSIVSYRDGYEQLIALPEGSVIKAEINGKKFVALRTSTLSENSCKALSQADYILLCKGCKELPAGLSSHISANGLIVTHPSLHWRYEKKILAAAKERNLPLHSLRYDGPLHVFTD